MNSTILTENEKASIEQLANDIIDACAINAYARAKAKEIIKIINKHERN